ncbi:MAG: DUF420 domain-containing protein, partial [Anaerolineae bacterium]|nr:DUF420 domain-containing protein [Anaerolineae bacterium]
MQPKKSGFVPPLTVFSVWGLVWILLILVIGGLLVLGVPEDLRSRDGFLDTNAGLMSDLSLLAYVLLLIPLMVIGYGFARNKNFVPHHQVVMTAVVTFNWALILFIMVVTFNAISDDIPDNLEDESYFLPLIHMIIALAAQILGTYLVIRMWFENTLPAWAKVKNIKLYMRLTLAGWLIAAALGISTYIAHYNLPGEGADSESVPAATPEVTEAAPVVTQEAAPGGTQEPDDAEEAAEELEEQI